MVLGKCWFDVSFSVRGLSVLIFFYVMVFIFVVKLNVKFFCVFNFVCGIGSMIDVGWNLRFMFVFCFVKVRGGFCWVIGEFFMFGCGKI